MNEIKIYIPKLRGMEARQEIKSPACGLAGLFKMVLIRPDGRRRIVMDWNDNLVVTQGLNNIGADNDYAEFCCVGSGNTAPVDGNSTIETFIAVHSSIQSSWSESTSGSSPYYGAAQQTYRFNPPGAAKVVREVTVGTENDGTGIFSRSLTTPSDINWASDETLDVTYQQRLYLGESDTTGTISISGTTHTYTARLAGVANKAQHGPDGDAGFLFEGAASSAYNGSIGLITGLPSGSSSTRTSVAVNSYNNGDFYRSGTLTWGPSDGNLSGGIKSFLLRSNVCFQQVELDPVISKTNVKTLDFPWRSPVWAKYTP